MSVCVRTRENAGNNFYHARHFDCSDKMTILGGVTLVIEKSNLT